MVSTPGRIIATKFNITGKKNSNDHEIVKELLTEFELIVDSYEQPIERPLEYETQKSITQVKRKLILEKTS
ncbi:hypothetical protein [Nodularia spumigena]|uniref:hypothetical protein n=1 Tax=Nodularia spumigena TaxID=70799 RepID=UPI00232ECF1A|nr:hypothetical protein [Nodularia spumigena]MDB9346864.1 hypothetical protein [Nodularia spumigena CS-588/01]MDB9350445.1 hypothetical protein [Nodularia spumigena CS-588/05]MEA5558770.1 hypothetical protein [Nodularia spumigena CH309]